MEATLEAMTGLFIPAPAGNRVECQAVSRLVPVHPRASGEQYCTAPSPFWSVGSSPRLRGTVVTY